MFKKKKLIKTRNPFIHLESDTEGEIIAQQSPIKKILCFLKRKHEWEFEMINEYETIKKCRFCNRVDYKRYMQNPLDGSSVLFK